jgi:murein DD-endopeptidase MepM/ murein hydrolase activator NlpD
MRRSSKHITVLIAKTGKTPVTLSLNPIPIAIAIAAAILTPLAIAGVTIYSLNQENQQLNQRTEELTETADEVLTELEALDTEIEALRERAGISEEDISAPTVQTGQGGFAIEVSAEELFQLADRRIPQLLSNLSQRVRPALETTLNEEEEYRAARPSRIPLTARYEVSSEFGIRRNPFSGTGREFHNGIDFIAPYGTPIYPTGTGTVERAEWSSGYGYHVMIDHGYGYKTLYAHLSELKVTVGTIVDPERIIGYLGNTGRSSGPHLHYTIFVNETAVNPRTYLED